MQIDFSIHVVHAPPGSPTRTTVSHPWGYYDPDCEPLGTEILISFRGADSISGASQAARENANMLDGYGNYYPNPTGAGGMDTPNPGITFRGDATWKATATRSFYAGSTSSTLIATTRCRVAFSMRSHCGLSTTQRLKVARLLSWS